MRPFDEVPFEESNYSDVALMLAGVREWPSDDFSRELDARVARRFAPEAAPTARGNTSRRSRLPRWAAGPAVALVAGVVAAVVVLSGGGTGALSNGPSPLVHGTGNAGTPARNEQKLAPLPTATTFSASSSAGTATYSNKSAASTQNAPSTLSAAVAPGAKQIRSAQLNLSTQNVHVNQVAQEIFGVVGSDHGTVLSSHITTATRGSGGGYASFSLSIPTGNLQDAMTQLSRLHYVAVVSSDNSSQNVSRQYNSDQRQLTDAQALRTSLLKQLAAATTDQEIDSIKAQLKLAEQQITSRQNTLGSLQHRISYSNLSVQVNQNGLPIVPVAKHHSSGFTISHAGHDAMRVLVVSAGVALITLAVMIPVGLVAALLMWLWVWLRQRRREHALDSAS